jgi:hypothetical protein
VPWQRLAVDGRDEAARRRRRRVAAQAAQRLVRREVEPGNGARALDRRIRDESSTYVVGRITSAGNTTALTTCNRNADSIPTGL